MLSFLGPIISLVSAPVKSYMEERTAKVQSKAKIAEAKGVSSVLKIKNGYLVDLSNEGKIVKELENGKVALNGSELIPTNSVFFKERKKMLYHGVVSINILITNTGDLFELPRIKFLAVLNQIDNVLLQNFSEFIEELLHPYIPLYSSKENQVKTFLIKKIKKYIENNFHKNPSIILDIIYIEE